MYTVTKAYTSLRYNLHFFKLWLRNRFLLLVIRQTVRDQLTDLSPLVVIGTFFTFVAHLPTRPLDKYYQPVRDWKGQSGPPSWLQKKTDRSADRSVRLERPSFRQLCFLASRVQRRQLCVIGC